MNKGNQDIGHHAKEKHPKAAQGAAKLKEWSSSDESRFKILVDNLTVGVYRNTAEPAGKFLETNPAHYKMYGYDSAEEFLRVPVMNLYANPKERSQFLSAIKQQGFVKDYEILLRRKDGTLFWGAVTAKAQFNASGQIECIDGVLIDITQRKELEENLLNVRHELEIKVKVRTAELAKANEDLQRRINQLRQAEELLRESETRYRGIVEDQTDLLCRFLPDGTLTFVNEVYCRYFSKKPEELIGKNFLPFIAEEDRKHVKLSLSSLVPGNQIVVNEERVVLASGEVRWQHWINRGVFDAQGKIVEVQAVGRDITDRKRMEDALKESEAQYRTTLDSMGIAIHVVDKNLKVIMANTFLNEWCEKLGVNGNITGKTIFEAFPFLHDKVRDEYARVFENGKVLITQEFSRLEEKEVITETRKIPIFEGKKVVRVVTAIEDITVRRSMEHILRESEERYKRIAESITDYIFTVLIKDGRPAQTVYGPTCLAVTGYSPEEFKLDPYLWIKMVHEEDRKIVQESTALLLSGEKTQSFEHRIIRKDGAIRWIRNTSVAHVDDKGAIVSYDGLIQDITERKEMEKRLERINSGFIKLGADPAKNIESLVALCGEIMGADCAMYNRTENGRLLSVSRWKFPDDFKPKDTIEGTLCNEAVKHGQSDMVVLRNLSKSAYAKSDPHITKYHLQTYVGYPVRLDGKSVGSLCAFYRRDYLPVAEDKKIMGIVSSAIGVEEERRNIRALFEERLRLEEMITGISAKFITIPPEEVNQGIAQALEAIGRYVGVDRSYVYLVSDDQNKADLTFEWCAEGVPSQLEELKGLSAHAFPWFAKKLIKQESVVINKFGDFPDEAVAEKKLITKGGAKSLILVPMVYGKSVIGILGFDSLKKEISWPQETITLLKTVGEVLSNALEHKYADDELRKGERFLTDVFTSIQDGISILDNDLNIIRVNPTMEQWYSHYMPLTGKKCYEAYHGRKEPCKVCPSCRTIKTGEAAYDVVPKIGAECQIVGWLDLYSFPLLDSATGKINGVIEYVRDITAHKRAEQKLEILNRELIKSNKRLKQLALKDSHTGLFNHRYLEEVIEAEFDRARRYAHPLSVMMIDVDYFKSINDVYGHQFGDLALKQLAFHLKKMVRKYDIIIRFGGEEFVIVFPGTDRATTLVLAQRLMDSMTTHNFGNKEHTVKLKLSGAVASYPDDKITRGMDLVEVADQILNKVKEFGGNKVYSSLDMKERKAALPGEEGVSSSAKFLREKLEKLSKRANQSLIEAVFAFAKTIEVKDHYTGEHVESTVHYATEIAQAMKLPKYEIELIRQASMLHDLGKIGISERILNKNSKLEKKEFDEIKKHPQIGVDIIRPIQFFHNIIPLMLYHHERWDGKGYPRGLKGEEIPIGARIIAIADVYQALTSHRPYRKKAFTKEEAIKIIEEGAGTQFDPKIAEVFFAILKKEK
ncbi:MAG: PAS domain S-box protein [Candidatus Omnitrophica bacterium]|nr:PAS domain S-box protein [Candidatus Omnitrophota bacterium]